MSTSALKHKQTCEQNNNEELNLLYVALTRAKQILVITGSTSKRSTSAGWHAQCCQALEVDFSQSPVWECELGYKPENMITSQVKEESPIQNIDDRLFSPIALESIETSKNNHETASVSADEGIIIHKLLEILSEQTSISDNALLNRTNKETHLSITKEELLELKQEALNCINSEELSEIFHPSKQCQVFHEVSIANSASREKVNIIDHMIVSPEAVRIIDYKSQQSVTLENAQEESVKYKKQLRRYAQAVEPIYKTLPIRCSVVFTKIAKLIDVEV